MFRPKHLAGLTTITASRYRARASRPSAALRWASRLLMDAAATPPLRGGECALTELCLLIKNICPTTLAFHDQSLGDHVVKRLLLCRECGNNESDAEQKY